MATTKNFVLLALMQVGIVVAGVLASATTVKLLNAGNGLPPELSIRFADLGILLLVVPSLWIWCVMKVHLAPRCSELRRRIAFLSGLLLLAVLVGLTWATSVRPFLQLCGMTIGSH